MEAPKPRYPSQRGYALNTHTPTHYMHFLCTVSLIPKILNNIHIKIIYLIPENLKNPFFPYVKFYVQDPKSVLPTSFCSCLLRTLPG